MSVTNNALRKWPMTIWRAGRRRLVTVSPCETTCLPATAARCGAYFAVPCPDGAAALLVQLHTHSSNCVRCATNSGRPPLNWSTTGG